MSLSALDDIKALAFDVGGSVFDWQTPAIAALTALASKHGVELDAHAAAHGWRMRMFQLLAEVRRGRRERANADELHRTGLDQRAPEWGLPLTAAEKDELVDLWHTMQAWDDFPDALTRLRTRYKVVILSVLSYSILVDSSKHAGLSWDGILSCEFLTHYKPEPEAYQQGASLLRLEPAEVMMVAVHPPDLAAAAQAGMRTGYVAPKIEEAGSAGETSSFDIIATDFDNFASQVGC